jgi:predicted transcriptional regulator
MPPQGLGTRQAELIQMLADFEKLRPAKDGGLSTNQLAAKVFGRKFTPADRVQVARAVNKLLAMGMVYRVPRGGKAAYWRLHPRIAALTPA